MDSISKSEVDLSFGKILRDFRAKNELTQEVMAEKLGISVKYISRIENGNGGLRPTTLIHYMNILGIIPNVMYKDFIVNDFVKSQIELSEKAEGLSKEKLKLLISIAELLKNLD